MDRDHRDAAGDDPLPGYPIQELIRQVSFLAMIWPLLKGELPRDAEAEFLGTALMAAARHGPQAPSIAIARDASAPST